ncbi:helicase HerA domain-containing protein [Leptothrix sp. BB-4]
MKSVFLSALQETVCSAVAFLSPVEEISDDKARISVDSVALDFDVATQLKVGAFLVLLHTPEVASRPQNISEVLPQALVCRIDGFTSLKSDVAFNSPLSLKLSLLGMFATSEVHTGVHFSRDIGRIQGASHYFAFMPSPALLDFIVNGTLGEGFKIQFGLLRQAESVMVSPRTQSSMFIHMPDIRGKRTAMFGKTRLGKSNAVKLLMQGMLEMTAHSQDVGQLVFDVNGEYANDNPQDGNRSIASTYEHRTDVYFLAHRDMDDKISSVRRYIRYNFYERTSECGALMTELLDSGVLNNETLRYFLQLEFPSFSGYVNTHAPGNATLRLLRRIQLLWTILYMAGFSYSEDNLVKVSEGKWKRADLFNPRFSQPLRMAMYQSIVGKPVPRAPANLKEMAREMEIFSRFCLSYQNDPNLVEGGVPLMDKEEEIAMRFIVPEFGVGPRMLASCIPYHSEFATDFLNDIISSLDQGRTVIVDLGSANQVVLQFFSRTLSVAVFRHQEAKFVTNQLKNRFVQLYFEEAHMIFPANKPGQVTDIYSRFAKEGAKFHIGIVYSTQSPSTVNSELLSQTENFFIGHISNKREFELLGEVQNTFTGVGETVLRYRQPGYMQVLTHSHRYVIPVQARVFDASSVEQR